MSADDQRQGSDDGPATPSEVTEADLRQLLGGGAAGTRLVLREGRIRLAPDGDDGVDGLTLVTRDELAGRVGDHPDAGELEKEAEALNTQIRLQGA
ncbi:hypothetical protein [Nocardia blacklockiae]|uniref:hypothetical protein n=1 Tax=Nocardia blacklockiae TaxID=480036 RepID=UPI001895E1E8|nr:hypothetical protein [Nocardia blacklockiae]MBF6174062.1 hypothetical protein [Nocardia blacklockiae]